MSDTPPLRRPLATFLRATPTLPAPIPTPPPPATSPEQALPATGPTPATTPEPAVMVAGLGRPDAAPPGAPPDTAVMPAAPSPQFPAGPHDLAPPGSEPTTAPAEDAIQPAGAAATLPTDVQAPAGAALLPSPGPVAPRFARRGPSHPPLRASRRQWALLLGLVGLLGLQMVMADRARLAGDARWRPLAGAACAVLRCTLPAWREPAALTLLNREVRPHPGLPGVLQIQASFRNDARWAQAWPWLQLSLSDVDGRVIGTRMLTPQDYLGQVPAGQDTLAPGQAVHVAFAVREPAASTAAFRFDFR